VRRLGEQLDDATAVVIFPEGRLFRPDRLERAKQRLAAANPDRSTRLASLSNVLPPRPGGVLALLDAVPADVVVIAHSGLDRYASFRALAKAVPLRDPVRVTAWRIPRDTLPTGDEERLRWLDEQWCLVDDRVGHHAPPRKAAP
jgi:1-acyl-sn-glycerol-3-phosphate acyltransferase